MDIETLDTTALDRLTRLGGHELLRQMIDLFLEQASAHAETLSYLYGDVELAEVERAAHSLKTGGRAHGRDAAERAGQPDGAGRRAERPRGAARAGEGVAGPVGVSHGAAPALARRRRGRCEGGPIKRIAVVEDNADNRLLLQAILDDRFDLIEYENGPEALEGFAATVPDIVLMDISLPGMDGTEVLMRLRRIDALGHVPVIALTAHVMSGDRERFLDAGFDDYVTKPIVDETILIDCIDRLLAAA